MGSLEHKLSLQLWCIQLLHFQNDALYFQENARLELLLETKLHCAKMLTVHATGQGDAAYDDDNSVGISLSTVKHALKKRKKKGES